MLFWIRCDAPATAALLRGERGRCSSFPRAGISANFSHLLAVFSELEASQTRRTLEAARQAPSASEASSRTRSPTRRARCGSSPVSSPSRKPTSPRGRRAISDTPTRPASPITDEEIVKDLDWRSFRAKLEATGLDATARVQWAGESWAHCATEARGRRPCCSRCPSRRRCATRRRRGIGTSNGSRRRNASPRQEPSACL